MRAVKGFKKISLPFFTLFYAKCKIFYPTLALFNKRDLAPVIFKGRLRKLIPAPYLFYLDFLHAFWISFTISTIGITQSASPIATR